MKSTKNLRVDFSNKFEKKMINIGSIHTITSQKNPSGPESTISHNALDPNVAKKFCEWCGSEQRPGQ